MRKLSYGLTCFGGLFLFSNSACIISGPIVWTADVTETIRLDRDNLKALEVHTHNGAIRFTGQTDPEAEAVVTVTKKAGGRTPSDAERALEALEVYADAGSDGRWKLGYRWTQPRRSGWGARVAFDIVAPAALDLDAVTQNGKIQVSTLQGNLKVSSRNGPIKVESSSGSLSAETRNGGIEARYEGPSVELSSRNGAISADFSNCGPLGGSIVTRNGGVALTVSDKTSANLSCVTRNGSVKVDPAITTTDAAGRAISGTLGQGGPDLSVTTRNGGIRVKKAGAGPT
jgi:hypothetical protein